MIKTQTSFVDSLVQQVNTQDALGPWRQKAFDAFVQKEFFSKKFENYQHVRLRHLKETSLQACSLEKLSLNEIAQKLEPFKEKATLVIYNGHFLPRFSNLKPISNRLIVKPLSEAFLSYGVFFKNLFQKWLKEEKDPWALLAFALEQDGLFIYAPNHHIEEQILHIVEINDGRQDQVSASNLIVSCGKNSQLKLSSTQISTEFSESLVLGNALFNCEDEAQVELIHLPMAQNGIRLDSIRAYLKKKSSFKSVGYLSRSKTGRLSYFVQLLEEHSAAEVYMLSTLKKEERAHIDILIEHRAENCFSRQLVKNLLNDKSLSSFDGKIWVEDIAQQTNAYQLNHNCLLSDDAKAYSKPGLEIFADDVKASHGSTTGHVDQEALFYLQSRGLSQQQARKLLLDAFCQEVFQVLKDPMSLNLFEEHLRLFFEESIC